MVGLEKVRKDFPILKRKIGKKKIVYLDNAATTQKPKQVIETEVDFYEKFNANVHRGMNILSAQATEMYEQAHEKSAKFLGAQGIEEIVFTKNATESLNLLAYSLGNTLQKGDEVLLTKMEHHANLVPWQQLAKRNGVRLKYADVTQDGKLDLDDFESKITSATKIVSLTAASNILGTINPVEKLGKSVKKTGAYFIVDAAQAAPHMKINVKKIGADFLALSAHKMLGPTGVGVLYGKEELLEKMDPFLTGGDMISTVTLEGSEWNKLPWKFEAGTPNIAGAAGFGGAIEYLGKVGMDNIHMHEQKLLQHGVKRLSEINGVTLYGPAIKDRTGIISFNIDGIHPHDVSEVLSSQGVIIRAGNHCAQPLMAHMGLEGVCRASFYIYNTEEEIEHLARGIEKAKKIFGV